MIENILLFIEGNTALCIAFSIAVNIALFLEFTKGGRKINVQQLVQMMNREEAFVIDVRNSKNYDLGHISGSVNIPLAKVLENLTLIQSKKGTPVLVCDNGMTTAGIGEKLKDRGCNVYRLHGGIGEWQAANIPLAQGKQSKPKQDKRKRKNKQTEKQ